MSRGLELGTVRRLRLAGRGEPAADHRSGRRGPAVGAHVEGEIESITGVEDGVGSDDEAKRQTLEVPLDFIERTGVDVFAPSIGNAHGVYSAEPVLDFQRVTDIVEATGIPIALHGGSGMTAEQFPDLIARGCAKVNISTAPQGRVHEGRPRVPARRRGGRQVGPAVAVPPRARGVVEMASGTSTRSAARERPGDAVRADLRLRRRARRHRAVRAPAGVQPDVRRVRAAGAVERGGVRREARRSAAARSGWRSLLTPEFVARRRAADRRRGASRAGRPVAPAQDRDLHRDGGRRGACPLGPASPGSSARRHDAGWQLAVASTSAEPSVRAVLEHASGADDRGRFAGLRRRRGAHKKPAPDIYLLAIERLGVPATDALVVEDSGNGLLAAPAAGLACLVTVNELHPDEDFPAPPLWSCRALGDPGASGRRCWPTPRSPGPATTSTFDDCWRAWCPRLPATD